LARLKPVIEAAIPQLHGTHDYDDLVAMVMVGRLKLWAFENSFALSEVIAYPKQKHYHVFLAGGRLDDFVKATPQVLREARQLGCARITETGRLGFLRKLKNVGFKEMYHTMGLEIEP